MPNKIEQALTWAFGRVIESRHRGSVQLRQRAGHYRIVYRISGGPIVIGPRSTRSRNEAQTWLEEEEESWQRTHIALLRWTSGVRRRKGSRDSA